MDLGPCNRSSSDQDGEGAPIPPPLLLLAEGCKWRVSAAVLEESTTQLEEGIHSQNPEFSSAEDHVIVSLGSGLPWVLTPYSFTSE